MAVSARSGTGVSVNDSGVDDMYAPQVFLVKVERGPMKSNNYLVVDPLTHQAVVIDPAWELDKLQAELERTQSHLSGILITHTHSDHIDLARTMAEFYNCPIWMSHEEIAFSGFDARQLVPIGQASWSVGGMRIEPILTPGHTPGCVCFLISDNLFTGDVLFAEGCGICFQVDAAYAMFESLQYLKTRVSPQTHVFPGHTYVRPPGQKLSELMRYNIYLQFADKETFAAYRLRKGQGGGKILDFR